MYIIRQCAQDMVDKTIKTLGYNINIMDEMGIIIGSGDKKRLNTYHQGAEVVIKTGSPLIITSEQAFNLKGVKPGINLPICLNDKIVGVVGITGEPSEIAPFAELIKISTESMLQQAFLTEQLKMEQNAKELYITDLINNNYTAEDEFIGRGIILGYNMKLKRLAIVLKIHNLLDANPHPSMMEDANSTYNTNLGYTMVKNSEKILSLIKKIFKDPNHMISYSGSSSFLILYVLKNTKNIPSYHPIKNQTLESIESLQYELEKKGLKYNIGVGMHYPGIQGLRDSYKESIQAIKIKETANDINSLVYASDKNLEILINNLPESTIQQFKQRFTNTENNKLIHHTKLLTSLSHFLDFNLNTSKASESLHISRNTLSNHLDKIMNITGLDPRNFNDAIKLKIFLLIMDQ